ncbi:MAG: peptidoglycan DD-metalloendopeptidase family protein [Bacteroidales bacterium]|nr:peptidoglycan DD-metalloendopeptidase family protein [Bacteroidales bacterium]
MKRFSVVFLLLIISLQTMFSQDDIATVRRQYQEALERIEATDKALSANEKSVKNQLYRYNVINDQVKESQRYLNRLNAEYNKTRKAIGKLNEEIKALNAELKKRQDQYAKMVRQLYIRLSDNDKLMFIFAAEDLNQSWRRMRYLNDYAKYQRKQAELIKEKQAEIEAAKVELEAKRKEQADLVAEQSAEQKRLQKERSKQNSIVQNLKKKRSSLQAELRRDKQRAERLNSKIEEIIAAENKKSSASGSSGTASAYAMNVDEKKLATEFGNNKGKLPFPVSEPGTIIVHFGEQKHKDMKYVQTNSSGIDIQTKSGASARAIFKGTVSRVFSVQGTNFSIIVRHGNYLSVYSNLEKVSVKAGQTVKIGDKLGTIYSDPEQNNLTIMHFQIWKDLQKLDPELWLKKN